MKKDTMVELNQWGLRGTETNENTTWIYKQNATIKIIIIKVKSGDMLKFFVLIWYGMTHYAYTMYIDRA